MNDQTDAQLLRAYAESRSEAAFGELVRRHVDFVYSAARRMVCDPHLAEDVTQSVFVALAKSAGQLLDRPVLSGWLHRTAQNIAAQTVRTIERRRAREKEAAAMNELIAPESDVSWEHIAPHLDAALGELSEPDRDALLLRYFHRKSAHEMAESLGISDEAAQKRVNRAVERLRELFAKRGVTVGAGGLVMVISANAVQAAPAGLAVTISTAAALAGTTLATAATTTATKAIAMTTLQKTLITTTIVAAVGTGIYEARQASILQTKVQTFQQQQAPLAEQIHQLQRERDEAKNRLATLADAIANSKGNSTELLKLRAEVARLRADAREWAQLKAADTQKENDPMESAAKALQGKLKLLKQRLEQMPDKNIPELQYLSNENMAHIALDARLDTDAGVREALFWLRNAAKQFFTRQMWQALRKYVQSNNGQLPTDVSQLKPYFEVPVHDTTLARYKMIRTGNAGDLQPDEMIVAEKAAVDDEYDELFQIGLYGQRFQGVGKKTGENGASSWP